jgi:hypothetical protein
LPRKGGGEVEVNGKKYHVKLTEAQRKRLLVITKKGIQPVRQIIRANILLHLEESGKDTRIAEQTEIARRCHGEVALVYRVSRPYEREGRTGIEAENPAGTAGFPNSNRGGRGTDHRPMWRGTARQL